MKKALICIYIFSTCLLVHAQDSGQKTGKVLRDSLVYNEYYGLRLGADVAMLARTVYDYDYTGFEIQGDYRYNKNLYLAAEIGRETYDYTQPYLDVGTQGNYLKVGVNYNTFNNLLGMQNELYVGFRYGFSTFTQKLYRYIIYNDDNYFPIDIRNPETEFSGLTAHFAQMQLGIKTEVFHNVFLGLYAQINVLVSDQKPDNFDNLYIPGFNKTYDSSSFGAGWGYSISYLIPVLKKEHKRPTN